MGTKALIRLLIALAILGGIAAIIHFTGSGGSVSKVTATTDKKKVIADFPINDVSKIVVKNKDESMTLEKGESSWEVAERDGYAAEAEPIVSMLRDIWDLNIVQPVAIGRSQYGRVGLIAPDDAKSAEEGATILTFQDAEGKELESLWLGKIFERNENRPNPFGGGMATSEAGRYVKRGSGNSVYLVGETFADVQLDASEWIDKTFFKVEKIKSIELLGIEEGEGWKLVRKSENDDFAFAKPAEGEELDASKTSSMKSAFSNAQMEDVLVGDKVEKTDDSTFKITTFDGFNYVISVGEKNDLNELPLTLKVSAKFKEERDKGEEESDEEAAKLDKAFSDELASLKEKLATEKALEGHTFLVRSYLVDSITKKRSELLKEEEEPETPEGEEVAPGVTLPGLSPSGN